MLAAAAADRREGSAGSLALTGAAADAFGLPADVEQVWTAT